MSLRCSQLSSEISPVRLKRQGCRNVLCLKPRLEIEAKQHHGVSTERFPSQTGFPQTGGPENDVGHPGEIHGAAADRLRRLRDSLVSYPGRRHTTSGILTRKLAQSLSAFSYFVQQNVAKYLGLNKPVIHTAIWSEVCN